MVALSLTALFAALIAAGAFISVPLPFSPVPIVLQNLFAVLAGLVLGPLWGSASVALFLLAGAIGLPVFAGATGGIAQFAGPTGGFLFGYLLAGCTAGLIAAKPSAKKDSLWKLIAASAAGFIVIYVPGVIWLSHITGSWKTGLVAGCLPFLPGDAIKAVLAVLISGRMRRLSSNLLEN
jgi:biotin transport system substrate-specific component